MVLSVMRTVAVAAIQIVSLLTMVHALTVHKQAMKKLVMRMVYAAVHIIHQAVQTKRVPQVLATAFQASVMTQPSLALSHQN